MKRQAMVWVDQAEQAEVAEVIAVILPVFEPIPEQAILAVVIFGRAFDVGVLSSDVQVVLVVISTAHRLVVHRIKLREQVLYGR